TVSQPGAGAELKQDRLRASVPWGVAPAPEQHPIGRRVVALDSINSPICDREMLQAETETDTQPLVDLPAIAQAEALLECSGAHRIIKLIRLAERTRQTQQECRIGVQVVGGRRTRIYVQRGDAVSKIKTAAGAVNRFRLPVIHLVVDKVEAGPQIVGALC